MLRTNEADRPFALSRRGLIVVVTSSAPQSRRLACRSAVDVRPALEALIRAGVQAAGLRRRAAEFDSVRQDEA